MGFFFKKQAAGDGEPTISSAEPQVVNPSEYNKEEAVGDAKEKAPSSNESQLPEADSNYQSGVRRIEAITTVWSKRSIVFAYAAIWLVYFVASTQEVTVRTFNQFATSTFKTHAISPFVGIMASVFGGLSKLPMAKLMDTWGRPQTMCLTMCFWTLGFVMSAASPNIEVYAAAQIFSLIGAQGISYCVTVFIADTSSLINRPLMLAFATSPYIVTTWIGGPIADAVLNRDTGKPKGTDLDVWRWGFGMWAIIVPIIVTPLIVVFWLNERKAIKLGLLEKRKYNLTPRAVGKWLMEIDIVGILILATGMAFTLLPLSLHGYQKDDWNSPMIIAMLTIGPILLFIFAAYEKWLAPVTFIPYHLLADRTVFFAGLSLTFIFMNSQVWGGYFTSMCMVAWNTGVTVATYLSNIYRVGSCFAALIIAYPMKKTGRFKWVNMYYSIPLMILGVGLMIKFRQPGEDIGLIAMTQIFVAFAGGPLVVAAEMAMMTPSDHQHIAVIMAILDLFGSIGSAIGAAVSTAIYTTTFKKALLKRVPKGTKVDGFYNSMTMQLTYKWGSEMRHNIALAYGETQRYELYCSVALCVCAWICTALWRDLKVTDRKQTKGNVV